MTKNMKFKMLQISFLLLTWLVVSMNGCGNPVHMNLSSSSRSSLELDLFGKVQTILQRDCMGCHTDGGSAPTFNYSHESDFVRSGLIVPGSPQNSKLIFRLKNFNDPVATTDNMPLNTTYQIPDSDYQLIYTWVLDMSSTNTPYACDESKVSYTNIAAVNAKRLSQRQYLNTLRDILVPALSASTANTFITTAMGGVFFPEDTGEYFKRENDVLNGDHANGFFTVADRLAQSVVDNSSALQSLVTFYINLEPGACTATTISNLNTTCRSRLVNNLASRIYRRPLRTPEQNVRLNTGVVVDELAPLVEELNSASSVQEGVSQLLFRLLVSPHFLLRLEDQNLLANNYQGSQVYWLSSFAVANRLSFRFWNSMPDQGLWNMALGDDLTTDEGYLKALNYVLNQQAKMDDSLREYFNDWLKLDRTPQFNTNARFSLITPVTFNAQLRTDMISEIQELGSYVSLSGGSYEDIFTTNVSFARSPSLLSLYGLSTSAPTKISESNAVRFPASQRAGILTRGAFLASGSEFASPIVRGHRVRKDILCLNLAAPPADAMDVFNSIPVPHITSTRDKVRIKTSGANCIGCHNVINPLGFALSNYNSFGSFITQEPIFSDTTTAIDATVPVDSQVDMSALFGAGAQVNGAIDYSEYIAGQQSAKVCFAEKIMRYSLGRPVSASQDACRLSKIYTNLDPNAKLFDAFRSSALDAEFRLRRVDP